MTHICVSRLTIIGSDNGLSPGWRQAIILTNAGILLIGALGRNFSEILIGIHTFSFKKMHLKMLSAKWRPFCLGLNVLIITHWRIPHSWAKTSIYTDFDWITKPDCLVNFSLRRYNRAWLYKTKSITKKVYLPVTNMISILLKWIIKVKLQKI